MNQELLDAAQEVVRQHKAFSAYGNAAEALQDLRRRAPGQPDGDYREIFEFLCLIYDKAANLVQSGRFLKPSKPLSARAKRKGRRQTRKDKDIDVRACLAELNAERPGFALAQKMGLLGWIVYWEYLR